MAIRLYAVIPEMENTSRNLGTDVSEFDSAVQRTKEAADTVAAGWEGDAREAFVSEQAEAIACYQEMSRLMKEYSGKIQEASQSYTDTDAQCARLLRSV